MFPVASCCFYEREKATSLALGTAENFEILITYRRRRTHLRSGRREKGGLGYSCKVGNAQKQPLAEGESGKDQVENWVKRKKKKVCFTGKKYNST